MGPWSYWRAHRIAWCCRWRRNGVGNSDGSCGRSRLLRGSNDRDGLCRDRLANFRWACRVGLVKRPRGSGDRGLGIGKGDFGERCFGVREGDFGDYGRGRTRGDDEPVGRRWVEIAGGSLKGAATTALGTTDVPEDGYGCPQKREESQNRDGEKNAHTPRQG